VSDNTTKESYPSSLNALYVICKIKLQAKAKMESYSTGCTTSKENNASGKKKWRQFVIILPS